MRKTLKILKYILIGYLIYFLVLGVLIFKLPVYKNSGISYDIEAMKSVNGNDNYAHIVETPKEALDVRLALLNEATSTINIAYYMFYSDSLGQTIAGILLKKADEGIKINIIIDNKLFRKTKMMKTLSAHSNINLYKYERKSLLLPFALQNSLHDKILTIDNKYGLIGGRNLLDRFFFENTLNQTNDRDVLIFSKLNSNSAVLKMNEYVDELINSNKTHLVKTKNRNYQNIYYEKYLDNLDTTYNFNSIIDNAIKVDNITFIRSPLNRLNKEPVVFNVIKELSKDSEKIIIQSPYIVKSRLMAKEFNLPHDNVTFITNSLANNPNFFATSGYLRLRNKLAKNGNLYEMQFPIGNHAKSVIIDDDISIIGSQNLDPRSFYLSTESAVVIYSKEFNEALEEKFNDLINNSLLVTEKGKYVANDNVTENKLSTFKKIILYLVSGLSAPFNEMLFKVIK